MKVCPLCGSRYSARIDFCFHDGAVLASAAAPSVTFDASLDPPEPDALSLPTPRRSATPSPARARTPAPLQLIEPPPDALEHGIESEPPVETDPNGSPLIAPPPPQRRAPEPEVVSAPDRPAAPSAAAPSTVPDEDVDESESSRGVPVWVWGALVAAVLIVVGGSAFAVGGMSFVAALTKLPGEPEPAVVVEPLEFPEEPDPTPVEAEPRPRLQLGIQGDAQGADTDTDGVDTDTDTGGADSGASEGGDATTLSAAAATPAPAESAGTASDPAAPASAPAPAPVATSPAPPAPQPKPAPASAPGPESPWGAAPSEPATAPAAAPARPAAPAAPASPPPGTIKVVVTIQNALPGTVLAIDGQVQPGTPPISTNLTPGKHAFRVTGPSGSAFTLTRDVQPGDDGTFRLVFPQVQ